MTKENKNYNSLDFIKWIMAIVVIAIHTHPLENFHCGIILRIYDKLIPIAVPFFFMCSGFLLFNKVKLPIEKKDESAIRIKNYIYHIAKYYLIWTLIFLPLTIYEYFTNDHKFLIDIFLFLRGFFLIGSHLNSWALWYLLSLLYSLILIYICLLKKKTIKFIVILTFILFVLGNFLTHLILIKNNLPVFTTKFINIYVNLFADCRLLLNPIYVAVRIALAEHKGFLSKFKNNTLIIALILFFVFNLFLPNNSFSSNIINLIVSTLVFIITLNLNFKDSQIWYKFRKSSTVIFFSHLLIFSAYNFSIYKKSSHFGFDVFNICLIGCLILSLFVLKFESKPMFKWLKTIF